MLEMRATLRKRGSLLEREAGSGSLLKKVAGSESLLEREAGVGITAQKGSGAGITAKFGSGIGITVQKVGRNHIGEEMVTALVESSTMCENVILV